MAAAPIALIILVGSAFVVGRCSATEPVAEPAPTKTVTKVITVPTVKTRIEYRDRVVGLAEPCKRVVETVRDLNVNDKEFTKNHGIIYLELSELGIGAGTRDITKINAAMAKIRPAKDAVGSAANERSTIINQLESLVKRCNEEVANQP